MSGCAGGVVRFGTLEALTLCEESGFSAATDDAGAADETDGVEETGGDDGDTTAPAALAALVKLLDADDVLAAATLPADAEEAWLLSLSKLELSETTAPISAVCVVKGGALSAL